MPAGALVLDGPLRHALPQSGRGLVLADHMVGRRSAHTVTPAFEKCHQLGFATVGHRLAVLTGESIEKRITAGDGVQGLAVARPAATEASAPS
ncbi:hypothetical protein BH10ACT9_BH10ACT9_43290 [soil metagenome]